MPKVEVALSDRTVSELRRMVEQGDFLNEEQAVEELLSMGLSAYDIDEDTGTEPDEELFTQVVEEQQDPAQLDEDGGSEYTF